MSTLPPIPIDRITAKERAKDLMAEARSAGRKLSYTQALTEVAKRHGYANVHQMTASYENAPALREVAPMVVDSIAEALAKGKGGAIFIRRLPGTGLYSRILEQFPRDRCVELHSSMLDFADLSINAGLRERLGKADAIIVDEIDCAPQPMAANILEGIEKGVIEGVALKKDVTFIFLAFGPMHPIADFFKSARKRVIVPQDPAVNPDAIGAFKFMGPSATGKTQAAKALSDLARQYQDIQIAGLSKDAPRLARIPGSTGYTVPFTVGDRRSGSWSRMQLILTEAMGRTTADREAGDAGNADTFRNHVRTLTDAHLRDDPADRLDLGVEEALLIVANLPSEDVKEIFNHAVDFLIEANLGAPFYGLDPDGLRGFEAPAMQRIFRGARKTAEKRHIILFNDGPAHPPSEEERKKLRETQIHPTFLKKD